MKVISPCLQFCIHLPLLFASSVPSACERYDVVMQYDILLKDSFLCSVCVRRVELSNKVAHQKYLMYIECATRVTEKRSSDSYKVTTIIISELLTDKAWLSRVCIFLSHEICGHESYEG